MCNLLLTVGRHVSDCMYGKTKITQMMYRCKKVMYHI